ncbi:MAG: hypothetical protein KGI41_03945 [Patescibacteria group bacterium]|nr:hypothetical protein [Patescibacteria group bacterium]MDE1966362.1 hypothetical protein [Patescibacteria group bacterium]
MMQTFTNDNKPDRPLASSRLGSPERASEFIGLLLRGYSYSQIAKRMPDVLPTIGTVAALCRDHKDEIEHAKKAYVAQYGMPAKEGRSCSFKAGTARFVTDSHWYLGDETDVSSLSRAPEPGPELPPRDALPKMLAELIDACGPNGNVYEHAARGLKVLKGGRNDMDAEAIRRYVATSGGLERLLVAHGCSAVRAVGIGKHMRQLLHGSPPPRDR